MKYTFDKKKKKKMLYHMKYTFDKIKKKKEKKMLYHNIPEYSEGWKARARPE